MLHVTTVIPLGSLSPITVIPMKLNSTINLKWRPLCVLVTCTFLSQSLPACLPLFLSPWRWLNQMTTVAVCHCQKTFQFGGPPTSPGTLPLQKAASPQVAPSEAGLVYTPQPPPPPPHSNLLFSNADEGPGPAEHACLSNLNKILWRRSGRMLCYSSE